MLICTSIASLACSFLSVCIQNASILKGASSGRISVDSNNNLILYVGQQKSVLKKCNNEKDCTLWHGCGYGNEGKDYWVLYYKDGRMNVTLDDSAIKRLKAIEDFTELGSGFKIANRDLSIRGAGDILGSEQAGFIDSVGIDLYLKILNEEEFKKKCAEIEERERQRLGYN